MLVVQTERVNAVDEGTGDVTEVPSRVMCRQDCELMPLQVLQGET